MHTLFAVSTPGIEQITRDELISLGLSSARSITGGVEFKGTTRDLYRANLSLRTASRVLLRLAQFHVTRFSELQRHLTSLEWDQFLPSGRAITMHVTSRGSALYHTKEIEAVARKAISSRVPVTEERAGQLVMLRLERDRCTVSIDSSGELLHKRGYRTGPAGKAPLRETLAAAVLLASEWPRDVPLVDPFCGSGTLAIEAALIATNRAPGLARSFAFMDWPSFNRGAWASARGAACSAIRKAETLIVGADRDAGAVRAAIEHARAAEISDAVSFQECSISSLSAPTGSGWVVTNPPYGERIGSEESVEPLLRTFGGVLRSRFGGWHVAMLGTNSRVLRALRCPFVPGLTTLNGGLRVHLYEGIVPVIENGKTSGDEGIICKSGSRRP